jgi:hypothetical protein
MSAESWDRDPRRSRRRRSALLILAGAIALFIAVVEIVLSITDRRAIATATLDPGLIVHDSERGWRLAPDWKGRHRDDGYDVRYTTNRYGYRGDFEQAFSPAKSRRYAVLGDSITFGFGVNDGETFVDLLNQRAPREEQFLNFAVPGYATDQEMLQAARALNAFRITDFVLVVSLANDLIDNMLDSPIHVGGAKPFFELERGRLVLRNHPVPDAGTGPAPAARNFATIVLAGVEAPGVVDRWIGDRAITRRLGIGWPPPARLFPAQARRFAPSLDLFMALGSALRDVATGRGAKLHIVLLGGRSFVADPNGYAAQYQDHVRALIVARAGPAGLRVLDLAGYLRIEDPRGQLYFPPDGPLTVQGNRIVAQWLGRNLRDSAQ